MNRRSFLSLTAAAAAGFALDPERLLWRPGQRTIFLLPTHRWSLGQIVLAAYDKVLRERQGPSWGDSAFLLALERKGVLRGSGGYRRGDYLEVPLTTDLNETKGRTA